MSSFSLLLLPLLLSHGDPVSTPPAASEIALEVPVAEFKGPELIAGRSAVVSPLAMPTASVLDWLDPSRELSKLIEGQKHGLDLLHTDVLLRGVYTRVENQIEDTLGSNNFTDFNLLDADVALSGIKGAWGARVSVDLGGDGPGDHGPALEDAYLRWTDREWGEVSVGRFKPYTTRSSEVDPEYLLFPTRTFIGSAFDRWDEGVQWHSSFDEFDWWFSVMNRENPLLKENVYTTRGEWSFYDGWWEPRESAKDAPYHARLIFGFTYLKDRERDEPGGHDVFEFDMHGTFGPFSLLGEWADLDKGVALRPSEEADYPVATDLAGNPWSITLGRMFGKHWQAGFRVQDIDDVNSTKSMGLALNWFPVDAPVVILGELTQYDQDQGPGERGLLFRLGLSYGLSRHDMPTRLR